jgi:hypothetical protein
MAVFDIGERLACRLVGLSRSAFRRPLKADTPHDPDRALRGSLRDYARNHARWGYRRAYVDAYRDCWLVNHKKIRRLWAEEGLRMDNGLELISQAVADWASETERVFIPPGHPWRNGFVESLKGNSATNASVSTSSTLSTMPKASSGCGGRNATPPGRTRRWGI